MSSSRESAAGETFTINDSNLSRAWSRLLLRVLTGSGTRISPLVLSLTGFDGKGIPREDPTLRQALDQLLKRKGRINVENVAFTIFPQRVWEVSHGDRTRALRTLASDVPALAGDEQESQRPGPLF